MIVLAACGGKTISIGGENESQSTVPSAVTVATSVCSQGYQHSTICCSGGDKDNEATCESWPNDPFHPCDSGWTTYPNAAECCSLDNPADCTSCSGSSNGACAGTNAYLLPDGGFPEDAGIPADNCETRCPPGYTGISPYDSKGCCRHNSNGSDECFGESSVSATTTPDEDGGLPPILLPDGGEYDAGPYDAGCAPNCEIDAGVGTGPIACEFDCPDGWFVADAIEGVCCNKTSSGGEECFAAVFPDDNGGSGGSDVPPSSGGSFPTPITDASAVPSH